MIIFECVRFEENRPRRRERSREGRHSAVSSGRRVHNTDASIILEILAGMKREQETKLVFTCICMVMHTRTYSGPSIVCQHTIPKKVTLYRRNIEPWRDIFLLRSDRSSSKTMDPIYITNHKHIFYENDYVERK